MDEEIDERADLAEYLRLTLIFGLLVLDAWIMWEAVKDRPDVLVLRQRVREAVTGPWQRYQAQRKAERHVVYEAMEVVGEKEEQP